MHERNIYKTPPNFADLAKKHYFLAPFISLNSEGVPKLNFKDQDALRALTKALLLEDFQLTVEIPEDVLVPTVPLRLNYILWIEDLLSYNNGFGRVGSEVCGIDVGTGATAIYALLAAKKNQWRMIGTEVDPESSMVAKFNVQQNHLDQIVEVRYVKDSVLEEVLKGSSPAQYDFTMCNPPFFGSDEETDSLQKSRKDRPAPSGAKTGTKNELIFNGGELEFITQMIHDSKNYYQSVRIFTTMIGIKKHVKDLVAKLRSVGVGVTNFTTTEFSQGKTTRWGLAWSFDPSIHLNPPPQVSHLFERIPGCLNFEQYIFSQLESLNFSTLTWISDEEEELSNSSNNGRTLHFIATENTWTGQRRRRREMERLKKLEEGPPPPKQMKFTSGPPSSKGQKNGHGHHETPMEIEEPSGSSSSSQSPHSQDSLLNSHLNIVRDGSKATISMSLLGGSLGKDGLNQIMTYLKNCYGRDAQNPQTELYQLMYGM